MMLWYEEGDARWRWPHDSLHLQAQRWRAEWNAGSTPAPLRCSVDLGVPPAAEAVPDSRELGHAMHYLRVAPVAVTDEPTKPVLPPPSERATWAEHLLVALFSKSERELANKSLTEIASKKVPTRITRDAIEMALHCTSATGAGGHRKSIQKMGLILMSEDATSAAVATFKLRAEKMKESDTDYQLPSDDIIAQSLQTARPQLAA